ncbi:hypothetical protein [Legionella donaldsonii]|uniref:hypothetical protein n=1 Tax=Legionella donaldsonii TaxID=45060 RepID=UPI00399C5E0F
MKKNIYDQFWNDVAPYDLRVIRGHLILEELLNKTVSLLSIDSKYIFKNQIKFTDKLAIVRSFDESGSQKIWELVDSINKLRNHIAHNLPYNRDQKKINAILNYPEIKKFMSEEIYEIIHTENRESATLTLAFLYIFAFFQGVIERLSNQKNQNQELVRPKDPEV